MLVLTRKPGQKIHIGGGITISVTDVRGNKVRLGIDAPADVAIVRAEINDFREPGLAPARQDCAVA